ncbi:MAG: bacterial Ig-like domain-containing protein, partial [Clostridia bacterium]|nr:bacterial Ig-like domain-containing protein [Clostridia bacterium]
PDGGAMYYSKDGGNSISKLTGSYTQATINALRVFADASNLPACFHCSYGRDRTGTVGVLLLGLLGVSYYDIVCDYEITFLTSVMGDKNTTIRSDEAVTKMMNWIMENYPADSLKESTEKYLLAAGLKEKEITAIRKNLLEMADGTPPQPVSIEVTTLPRKLSFLEGKNKLTVVGGFITVHYNIGLTENVMMDKSMVSGYDNTVVGPQTLTVTYGGVTTTYDIEIIPKSLTGITLTSLPTKLEYKEGEEFDPTGMEITADYDNGTQAVLDDGEYTVSGFESTEGEHTVTVSAGEFTATFTVTVTKSVRRGDPDGDGEITVADALYALRIAAKLAQEKPEDAATCDIDGDGEITVADALKILRVAAKLTDTL